MYLPEHFNETDPDIIFDFLKNNAFATIISTSNNVPLASQLPLLVTLQGSKLRFEGHMARANNQWQQLQQNNNALIIFQGPHSYVSPSYFQKPGAPTWNYVSIHAYGKVTMTEDPQELKRIVETLANSYESQKENSWTPDYPDNMLKAIIGFEIQVERLEAKYKLSQNRSKIDQQGIIEHLSKLADQDSQAIAELMKVRN